MRHQTLLTSSCVVVVSGNKPNTRMSTLLTLCGIRTAYLLERSSWYIVQELVISDVYVLYSSQAFSFQNQRHRVYITNLYV